MNLIIVPGEPAFLYTPVEFSKAASQFKNTLIAKFSAGILLTHSLREASVQPGPCPVRPLALKQKERGAAPHFPL